MSVEPVTKTARNPWKIATIVLASLMGLGLILMAIGAAFAFHRNEGGTRSVRPCMGSNCYMGGGMGNMGGGMGAGKGGMGGMGGMGGGMGGMGAGKGGMGGGMGGMGQGHGPVIAQPGQIGVQPGGPVGAGGEACTKIANPDGTVTVLCKATQVGLPTPMPMPTVMPLPGVVTPVVVTGSGSIGDASPGGDQTLVVVSGMAPADATPGATVSFQVTANPAPGEPGYPPYQFCTSDGATITCSDGSGAQPGPMNQVQCRNDNGPQVCTFEVGAGPMPMDQGCRMENGSTICRAMGNGDSPGKWDNADGSRGYSRAMMPGMALFVGGLFVTFLTALAALILAILAFRRKRSRPAPVAAAVTPPAEPVVITDAPDGLAKAEPIVAPLADAAAADPVKAEPIVAPLADAAAGDPAKAEPTGAPLADAAAADPVKAEPAVAPLADVASEPASTPKVRRTGRQPK